MYFGPHYPKSELFNAVKDIKKLGGNMIQIFLSNPMSTKQLINLSDYENKDIKELLKKNDFKIVIHGPYIINIARNVIKPQEASWILRIFNELQVAHIIGALGVVIHVGKSLELSNTKALNNMLISLRYLIQQVKKNKLDVIILLETAAGQGTEMLTSIEDLGLFYKQFSEREKEVLKICVDTCHIYSAGYDIRENKQVDNFFKDFNTHIGIEYLGLIHLNDSKREYNSHVDRHERIGKGTIGKKGLKRFVLYAKKYNIPLILETPDNGYIKEIPWIASLIKKA